MSSSPRRPKFVRGDLAVAVGVELGERRRSVLPFGGGDDAVFVGIEKLQRGAATTGLGES